MSTTVLLITDLEVKFPDIVSEQSKPEFKEDRAVY